MLERAVLISYYAVLLTVTLYAVHRSHLVALRRRTPLPKPQSGEHPWPSVTVQLPLFNEPTVAARVIEAAAALEYPGEIDIQVLDDSTDETVQVVEGVVARLRRMGIRIEHIRRESREGYKAGALAFGMTRSAGELFAIFDADFVPAPDTLARMVPMFSDPSVGMVQARWGHLNADESLLTRAQAIFLDAHFAVESTARFASGRFFNFNGTAGIWRREAIETAGGWSATTLTEDLDLSYRAQLAGWRFVFLPDVEVPAELPPTAVTFQEQQFRWAKGSIQTAKKLLGPILFAPIPLASRVEAWFHLTGNIAYLLTLLLTLLIVPAIIVRSSLGLHWLLIVDALLFFASTGSVIRFYIVGQHLLGRATPPARVLLALLPIGMSLSVRNTAAVLEGLFHRGGIFHRTPKRGSAKRLTRERRPRLPVGETVIALFLISAIVTLIAAREYASVPFLLLFVGGYAYAAVAGFSARLLRV